MHSEYIYKFKNSIEHELKFVGKYGCKGEKRAPRRKKTPAEMEWQNHINKVNRVRRLIKANFFPNDLWVCLKYPQGTRKTFEEVKADLKNFFRGMRRDYKKRYEVLKFIYRIEIGKRGGIHIHLLLNRIYGADLLIQKNWNHGRAHYTNLYEAGDYKQLASYIVKAIPEECKQMSLFGIDEQERFSAYNSSRNLIRPVPEKKKYGRLTVRRLINEGPKAREGFYVDKDSIRIGVNQWTGYSYMQYTEVRINQVTRPLKPPPEGIT